MSFRKEGTSAIAWSLIEKFLKRGVQFVLSIFLARLLAPSDFGIVAMASIFVSWAEVFSDFGMGQAIIQKKDVTETQTSTVFWINLMMGVLIAIIFLLIAPWTAIFYDAPMVAWVVRVAGFTFIIHALNVVQSSLFRKSLNFKVGTVASFVSSTISGVVGILLAYLGFGVWALLVQSVLSAAITTGYFWLKSKWRPQMVFNFKETKTLFDKGVGYMGQGLISNIFSSLDSMVIGKLFSSASLGLFSRGKTLAFMPGNTLLTPVTRPLFPIFAKINNDTPRLNELYLKTVYILNWASTFFCGFFIVASSEIITILYGNQWAESADYLLLFSLIIPLNANNVAITSVWKATGNVKVLVKITFIERLFAFIALGGLFFSLKWYAIAYIVADVITNIIKAICHKKYSGISLFIQYKEMLIELVFVAVTFIVFYCLPIQSVYISAVLKTIVFFTIYLLGCKLFDIKGMKASLEYVKPYISKLKRK